MKKILFLLCIFLFITNCTTQNKSSNSNSEATIKPELNDDGEYELHVLDSEYDYFLMTKAKPMSFYTEDYLKSRNRLLVSDWNAKYYSGRYRDVIESSIDYDPNINYGLEYEYRLFQVFNYVYWKYGLKLNGITGLAF
ncbi:DUF6146 family protein [Kaistella carnis]|uniref:Lipoprotein n=1 Tax=Kaistella carnis TaxID=1241979 RepID=A0A3G8XT22_9FLAO|nr:DUF6146 family protein [Kaistella carnis]AZI33384.1 hypothetical protein EIB73_09405 [Kaistella carnis]